MSPGGRTGKLLCGIGVAAFSLTFVGGLVESLRVQRRLPEIDLIVSGPEDHIGNLLAQKDHKRAIEQLQMQTWLQPSDPATHEQLGALLGNAGRTREARTQFMKLLRLRPTYAQGYENLGVSYLQTGELTLAARCFEQAIRFDSTFAQAHNDLGVARARSGDLEAAEKSFATAVELSPDYTNAKVNLDNVRKQLKAQQKSK